MQNWNGKNTPTNFDLKKLAPWNWFKKEQESDAGGSQLPVLRNAPAETAPSPLAVQSFYDLHRQMARLFAEAFRGFGLCSPALSSGFSGLLRPSLDIEEAEKEYRITLEIPGVEKNDIELTFDDGVLYIRGEKQREQRKSEGAYHCVERSYGSFQRALNLPADADENRIGASFKNGILTVTLGKREGEEKPAGRTIPIGEN